MNAGSDSLLLGMQDGRRIIARTIQNFAVSGKQLACLDQWGRECQATEVMICAVQGRLGKALSAWIEGMRQDPRFFFTFFRLGLLAIGRRLRTRWRLRK
jgi:hypothetical protein